MGSEVKLTMPDFSSYQDPMGTDSLKPTIPSARLPLAAFPGSPGKETAVNHGLSLVFARGETRPHESLSGESSTVPHRRLRTRAPTGPSAMDPPFSIHRLRTRARVADFLLSWLDDRLWVEDSGRLLAGAAGAERKPAEGEGLEPPSPFGRRISNPLTYH